MPVARELKFGLLNTLNASMRSYTLNLSLTEGGLICFLRLTSWSKKRGALKPKCGPPRGPEGRPAGGA